MTFWLRFAFYWLTCAVFFGFLWTAIANGLRRRRNNVVVMTEWRELQRSMADHPAGRIPSQSNCRKIERRVRVR